MIFCKVDYIRLGANKYPIAFNLKALKLGAMETKTSMNEVFALMQKGNLAAAADLIPYFWHALVVGHEVSKKDVPFEREDLEMMDFETLGLFTEAFVNAAAKMDIKEKKHLATVKKAKAEN